MCKIKSQKKFDIILYGDYTLTEDQIWPNGDGPENPTEQDVVDAINTDGGPDEVVTRWNLSVDVTVDEVTEH